MTFAEEMAEVTAELLGPGDDTFGEQFTISRGGDGYDAATRRRTAGGEQSFTVWGTFDSELAKVSGSGGLVSTHERILYAAPSTAEGAEIFEPGQAHLVVGEGRTWLVDEVAHVVKQGTPILWICGLKRA